MKETGVRVPCVYLGSGKVAVGGEYALEEVRALLIFRDAGDVPYEIGAHVEKAGRPLQAISFRSSESAVVVRTVLNKLIRQLRKAERNHDRNRS